MRALLAAAALLGVIGTALPAAAQPRRHRSERGWFSISGGVQPTSNSFSDAFDRDLYTEKEPIDIDYPVKSGAVIAASGGYRVWKRFGIGLGVTRYVYGADAAVTANVPHPFFDNTFRMVEGTTRVSRRETGAHLQVAWMRPLSKRLRLLLTAGPSLLSVSQTLISDVKVTETYPYDTAAFNGTTAGQTARTAVGFNAGADVFWMFSKTIGAGALVQGTHARARLSAGGRSVSMNAGGGQVAAGLRFVF